MNRALEQTKESEDHLGIMIDTIPVLAWSCRPDGTNEFLNRRWLDCTGLSLEEALGWGWKSCALVEQRGDLPVELAHGPVFAQSLSFVESTDLRVLDREQADVVGPREREPRLVRQCLTYLESRRR